MLKTGKKIFLLLLALALALGVLAGCDKSYKVTPLEGYVSSDNAAESNGGFVVKKDNWFYFVNGAQDYSTDNTFGSVVKGSLMRISETDLAAGNYSAADIVVPSLMISEDHTSGVFIYGDYVYYATPNTVRNINGEIESSYLNFKSTRLDGTETMRNYYAQVSDNTTAYRYVQIDGTVYLLYIDSTNTEIHSVNTQTGENTVLVSGYSNYAFDATDFNNPVVYYTMPVVKKNTYQYHADEAHAHSENESYNQLYCVRADATESPYTFDFSEGYVDTSLKEGDEGYEMEYVNFGTLILDGIGSEKSEASPFNHDWAEGVRIDSARGFTYAPVKYTDGTLILTVTNLDASVSFVYALDDAAIGSDWNSIAANPGSGSTGSLSPVSVSSDKATSSALYYEQDGSLYYIYVSTGNAITRIRVSSDAADRDYIGETTYLARQQEGATLLYLQDGYLYYSKAGTNGKSLYRIRYDGAAADYVQFGNESENLQDYRPTQYLALDYNSSWFAPEVVGGYLFFDNAESYAENYVYVLNNDLDNAQLKALNELYEDVQDTFTAVSAKFSNASNAAKYYFYTGDETTVYEEEHKGEYQAEDFEVLEAFVSCGSSHGFDFSNLKSGEEKANVQSFFYNRVGRVSEEDAETISDSLIAALLLTAEEE